MNRRRPLCLVAIAFLTAAAGAQDYKFTLNGKPLEPTGIHLSDDATKWAEGDVIHVDYHSVMLGKPGVWNFKSRPAFRQVLLLEQGGKETTVALRIEEDYSGDKPRMVNPLEKLPAAERAALRGLTLDAPLPDLAAALEGVKPAQLALTVTDSCLAKNSKALPPLPAELTWLEIDESSNSGIESFAALPSLTALRGLTLNLMTVDQFDAGLLAGMKQLRQLTVSASDLTGVESLGKLTALRRLDVAGHEKLTALDWCRDLRALESLDIARTGVTDLAPLSALPVLREIAAENSSIEKFGDGGGFTSLRKLNLLACGTEADAVTAFRKSHPQCEVLSGYQETLASAVKGTTRLLIRSGGTCHRRQSEEKTLFEVTVPAEIAELMQQLKFDEDAEPFHCMCCGEPSFEFYVGGKLAAMLGFHHGQGMRWAGGPWPGDVHLETNSAIWLCDWLEKHGVKSAGEELREQARQKAASKRRSALYRNVMSGELDAALRAADSAEAAAKAFQEKLPDALLRARVIFSLYGCTKDSWNLAAGMDEFITETLIPGVGESEIAHLAGDAALSEAARHGLVRWLFEGEAWSKLDKQLLAKHLTPLAEAGLTSPRSYNRQRTILILGGMKTPEAVALLAKVLRNTFKPAALKPEEIDEPGGNVTFHPGTLSLPDEAPDTAHAAVMLLRLKDKPSAAEVEKALAMMPAKLREKVKEAAKPAE